MRWSIHTGLTSDYAALIAARKMGQNTANNTINTVTYVAAAARIGRSDIAQQVMFRKDWLDIDFFRGFHSSLTSRGGVIKRHGSPTLRIFVSPFTVSNIAHSIVVLLYLLRGGLYVVL